MFQLMKQIEVTDIEVPFSRFEKLSEEIVTSLRITDIGLNESAHYAPAQEVYVQTISKLYRAVRESIKELPGAGKAQANRAALQTRKLLSMKPQVLRGDMSDIKALAIKNWDTKFTNTLKESLLDEAGLPQDESMNLAKEWLKSTAMVIVDAETKDEVLTYGKQEKRHLINTATSKYHIVLYSMKGGERFVAIEAPGKKPEVYKAG